MDKSIVLTGTVKRVFKIGGVEDFVLVQEDGTTVSLAPLGVGVDWHSKKVNVTIEEWVDLHPKCPDCKGDLGGVYLGRLESHAPGCPSFPL